MPLSRREFLGSAIALAGFRNETLDLVSNLVGGNPGAPDDEEFWLQIRAAFAVDPNVANFNNGGCSPSPRIVQDALRRQIEYANQAPSYYMWQHLEPEIEGVRKRLAKAFGCDPEEMAITRNASESLETCLQGFDLQPGDEVLTTTMDYPRMITTIKQRERRDGIKMVQVDTPAVPKSPKELTAAFEGGITAKTKLMLVSQVCFMNGQIYPVRQIVELGRKHGIPVIVDGAHAFAQFPFSRDQLGCDYYGTSLHKWVMAPIGTGFLYVRREKIEGLWPLMSANVEQTKDIRKFEEIGTHPAANHNAIGEALIFHDLLGPERKAARFRYLRHRWTDRLQEFSNVAFHTNLEPEHSCAITTVQIKGIKVADLHAYLLNKHQIYTTGISHPQFEGIRVTPNVYSTAAEVDRFGDAMVAAAKNGIL
ncbi:MAG: aminotransferase class V-fold PLP-dependent enzyme [Fimbriimonadaceae bacterium]|nr:aminotransferase class V-fold PLP-dependent enzyme [Fimbriimonadaceae bacterium]